MSVFSFNLKAFSSSHLNVGKVHAVEIGEHLVDLGGILEDGSCCLGQMVQTRVTSQSLRKSTDHSHLQHTVMKMHFRLSEGQHAHPSLKDLTKKNLFHILWVNNNNEKKNSSVASEMCMLTF